MREVTSWNYNIWNWILLTLKCFIYAFSLFLVSKFIIVSNFAFMFCLFSAKTLSGSDLTVSFCAIIAVDWAMLAKWSLILCKCLFFSSDSKRARFCSSIPSFAQASNCSLKGGGLFLLLLAGGSAKRKYLQLSYPRLMTAKQPEIGWGKCSQSVSQWYH